MFTYSVDEEKVVRVFREDQDDPYILQAVYPNGDEFESIDDAEKWAKQLIAFFTDELAPHPAAGKGLEPTPRLTEEEVAAAKAEYEASFNPANPE
jgi:hypothetical protein